jgi:hypothetical protein
MRGTTVLLAMAGLVAGCALHENGLPLALTQPDDPPAETGDVDADPGPPPADAAPDAAGGAGGEVEAGGGGMDGVAATGGEGGGALPDAATTMLDGAPPSADADRRESSAGVIECGGLQCNADSELCCAGLAGVSTCARRDVGCGAGTARACDGPEDCDRESVCCAHPAALGGYRSACTRPSDCDKAGGAPLCRGAADCYGPYKTCAGTELTGVTTCRH